MFDEAYEAKTELIRLRKIISIADHYKMNTTDVINAYNDYIDSDSFYAKRGI
jgi:hypothetical protein